VTSSSLLGSLHWGESLKMAMVWVMVCMGEGSNSTQECLNTTSVAFAPKSGIMFQNGGRIERSQFCTVLKHTMNFGVPNGL